MKTIRMPLLGRPLLGGPLLSTCLLSTYLLSTCLLLAWLCAAPAYAQETAKAVTHPAWEQLSAAERDLLVAPVRERWNSHPQQRARMMEHAQRWQTLTPEQRQRAHHGMDRWAHMDPAKRAQTRALFGKMRDMTPEQRKALRQQLKAMTPEQRKAWVEANTPQERKQP